VDYASWANELPQGSALEDGLCVRRFPVDPWQPEEFHALTRQIQRRYTLPVARQYDWLSAGPHSTGLVAHVAEHAPDYDAVIMMPYLHSITYDAAWVAGDRLVLWPCLHDERYAYMEPFRLLLESAWGVVFISPEEADLARQGLGLRLPRSAVVGSGVNLDEVATAVSPAPADPFLLYVGRLDQGKNVPLLYEYMARFVAEEGGLRLVVAGDGPSPPPSGTAFDFRGRVSEEEKSRLLAGALALCQPSRNESFSLVMMESWLAGRPVLVWDRCPVTRGHTQRSAGGLWFASYETFKTAVQRLMDGPEEARQMGANGRAYVLANYSWPDVFRRFAATLDEWEQEVRGG
jgi:glycosyltransferase involved in cell wall biosynthesis